MPESIPSDNNVPHLIIRPPRKWVPVDLKELWDYRGILISFTMRDIKIRYKQTALGFLWAIIQPLFMMVIFTIIFGNFAKIPSDSVPYPLFSFAALLPWMLFSDGLTRSTTSMITNANIMTKVYFPRLIMPIFRDSFPARGLCRVYFNPCPDDGILWICTDHQCRVSTFLYPACTRHFAGHRALAFGAECEVRDFQYTGPLHHPALDVCVAGCLPGKYDPGINTSSLWSQPDGRCD